MNEKEFTQLFNQYKDMVYKVAFLYLKNEADALDIVQNTFVKMYHKKYFQSNEHIKRWLLRVCINQCKNDLKSYRKTHHQVFIDEQYGQNYQDINLQTLVFQLPPRYKTVIYLYYYEGYSIQEIAQIMHLHSATVKQRLKRGREKLKVQWEVKS